MKQLEDADDTLLIEKSRQGNTKAFDEFMRRHRARVIRIARGMVSDEEDALDMAQEAFMKAFDSIGKFRGDCSPRTWIDRIVVNRCVDWQRRRKVKRRLLVLVGKRDEGASLEEMAPDTSWEADPITTMDREKIRKAVNQVLASLPAKQKAAFILRHWEGRSTKEVALVLECAEGTAKVHLHRATERMRAVLKPFLEEEA